MDKPCDVQVEEPLLPVVPEVPVLPVLPEVPVLPVLPVVPLVPLDVELVKPEPAVLDPLAYESGPGVSR